jgi:signal transduction histidine kinase/CheY-like chemotaxis protein
MAGTYFRAGRLASGVSGAGTALATNRLVLLAAVPLFLILAVCAYITIQFAANARETQAWVRHTYQVMDAQRRLQDDIQTAETGMRGYLITHDPIYERGFRNFVARIPSDIRAFRDLTRDNPTQQARADRLAKLLAERVAGFEAAVNRTAPLITRPPQAVTDGLARARTQMGAIRREVNSGLAEEMALLKQRDSERREQETLEIAFAIGAGIITLGIMLAAAALLVRNNISLAEAERARANEAAILRATLESVRAGIAYFNSDGLLCACNAHFPELLGLPPKLCVPRETTLAELRAAEAGRPQHIMSPPAESQSPNDVQHISVSEHELEVYKAPVATGGFLIGVVDVTARQRAEAMVRQSQKLEAVGHLTGGMAHDFNNLLQIISANLDLATAVETVRGDAKLRERLQNAIGAVNRGARLTGQLLAFARRQALEPRSIDLGRIIRDMSEMLGRTLGEQIEIETVVAGGLWNTLVDPTQVENTILNLAINARDAMPEGGKLTLEVANAYLDDAYAATHSEVAAGQYVMLAVSDTGTGMTPDVMARVFEPFFTTKPEGKGTGLGLAQAFGFVKQSGGHIKIYSEVGHGTTIKLYLPRTRREKDAVENTEGQFSLGGSETILVVEDDDGVRAAVADMLADLGYTVLRAESAESGLALLNGGAKADLLFTDVVMPGSIPTREFTRRAQEMVPGLKVLYTSGYTQNAIVHNGKLDDDATLLSKPYRKDELARKLRSVFAGTARGPIAPPAPVSPAAGTHIRKVLVVEDVALIRMTTVDMVEQLGFMVAEAVDGPSALAVLQQDGAVDILLTDLGLPGMNGRHLVEEALKLKPALKIVIASGYSTRDDTGLPSSAIALTKPFDLHQLKRALER